ncbi:MAG: hypothetical protein ACRBN8_40035 [Nannocystales bacterium]
MTWMTRLASLVSLGLLVSGCSLPEQTRTASGPSFTLTGESPIEAFDVTMCLNGPDPKKLFVHGRVNVAATTNTGRDVTLRVESLERPEEEEDGVHVRELDLSGADEVETGFSLVANAMWKGSGERCADPEAVQFSVESLEPGEAVTVDWDVTMSVRWDDGSFGKGPDDSDLRIDIEQL